MSEEFKVNAKAVLYVVTLIPALIDAIVGAVRAVKDGVKRIRGEKTSVQEAFEAHVEKVKDEIFADSVVRIKNELALAFQNGVDSVKNDKKGEDAKNG